MRIDGKDIARLDVAQLRHLMNTLLIVEANANAVPLTDLDLTTRETDPDGGIDAYIVWPPRAKRDPLAAGPIAFQYKSGKLKPKELREEFHKPGIKEVLDSGGSYVLVVSHDYPKRTRDARNRQLSELCAERGIPETKCKILYGDHIAHWCSQHLAIMALPELGKPLRGFMTVEQWRNNA